MASKTKKKIEEEEDPQVAADRVVEDLVKIAFANISDFARIDVDGNVHIFDYDKAREVGAKVSVTTRKVGRGKNAREVVTTRIRMPDKFRALVKLGEHIGLFPTRAQRRRKRK
jgi:Terminase small subunit